MKKHTMVELNKIAIEMIEGRGVTLDDIVDLVWKLQMKYYPDLTREICLENIHSVQIGRAHV